VSACSQRKGGDRWLGVTGGKSWLSSTGTGEAGWANVDGGFGWMRPGRDLDIMATLFTHAKEGNRFVDIDEDPVGVINRIYVW
jgi:hypothetical protein